MRNRAEVNRKSDGLNIAAGEKRDFSAASRPQQKVAFRHNTQYSAPQNDKVRDGGWRVSE